MIAVTTQAATGVGVVLNEERLRGGWVGIKSKNPRIEKRRF